ncbi:hypothetical protein FRC03_011561 [Tulasnella sp. 419]|nr:hypothetical protein FRC02_003844 [Tulasnella sp. 418]KAG8954102.1 hypothetical protein FRC03_011561 [Tulasnella sp. 419]
MPFMIRASSLMFIMCAVLQMMGFYGAFVGAIGKMGPVQYITQWCTQWQYLLVLVLTYVSGVLGNAFICWRLYVFWKRNIRVLIVPLTLLLGLIVCSGITISYEFKYAKGLQYRPLRDAWLQSVIAISLFIHVLVIGLMCWKVYLVSKSVSDLSPSASNLYNHIFNVFIESGALYAIVVGISFILRCANSFTLTVLVNYLVPSVIGLVPTLIVLRLLLHVTSQSRRATGHDIAPPHSQQKTVTQLVFAQATVGDTTRLSEFRRSIQVQVLQPLP